MNISKYLQNICCKWFALPFLFSSENVKSRIFCTHSILIKLSNALGAVWAVCCIIRKPSLLWHCIISTRHRQLLSLLFCERPKKPFPPIPDTSSFLCPNPSGWCPTKAWLSRREGRGSILTLGGRPRRGCSLGFLYWLILFASSFFHDLWMALDVYNTAFWCNFISQSASSFCNLWKGLKFKKRESKGRRHSGLMCDLIFFQLFFCHFCNFHLIIL